MMGDERVLTHPDQHRRGKVQQRVDPDQVRRDDGPAALHKVTCQLDVACAMSLTDERAMPDEMPVTTLKKKQLCIMLANPTPARAYGSPRLPITIDNAKKEHHGEPHLDD
eukprot:CAMPEP_0115207788 /NCGR_PEP_ID=MMETSP0270-20121206/20893_1 /TAXON_ID=71861 /ORGANISM="Scrippsiella trochoidea, Strain CCMP3099" /LENGTH=109 /DNA_ID=CAMNT_0002621385 /DNA_START=207 /DNA_END=537 /DNA_ORIENTATION=-